MGQTPYRLPALLLLLVLLAACTAPTANPVSTAKWSGACACRGRWLRLWPAACWALSARFCRRSPAIHWPRTLAQDTPLLLLDEPTTFLDIGHQLEVLDLVRRLNQERAMTIVLVLYDLNQAARYSDRMVVLQQGQIVADGKPAAVLTLDLLAAVFHVHVNIVTDPASGTPVCLPYAVVGEQAA